MQAEQKIENFLYDFCVKQKRKKKEMKNFYVVIWEKP